MRVAEIIDSYTPPTIDVDDTVYVGKFKNRKATVTGFTQDDHRQPVLKTTKGDQKLFKPRIAKLDEAEIDPLDNPKFKAWFRDSKVVDADGRPKVVYHGTATKFSSFDPKHAIGSQFWFTDSKAAIEQGSVGAQGNGIIMPVYLSIQKPCGWKEYENLMLMQIRSEGYDGIILDGEHQTDYIVFDSRQIKSVNNRTFGPTRNIYR